ncbi:uncharacterized protein LOC111044591 isoform X2 [Nilaparvata lugens]|uniref:uncharacterized protein LOC111044591 isoform X2 n=1 Tax=Nilaparvata lugens TaxID=108931 RepID=UPI00193CAFDD|nr:uncharacterized protein LOC111044591 isoform X2 [Nilaparvata lugens]
MVVEQLQLPELPVINNNAPAAADPHNQPRRGRGGGRRGGGGGRRGGAVRGREMREPEGQAIVERGGVGNDLEFLQELWPMDQAEHLSQRQVEYLAAIPIEEDDAVAGEDDLACLHHLRSPQALLHYRALWTFCYVRKERKKFLVTQKKDFDNEPMSPDKLSVFYKRFLDEHWKIHLHYSYK